MTTLADFRRRVFLNLGRQDGETNIAFELAINDAMRAIVRAHDFDELTVLDTANAATVANQMTYHPANDWGLTRPKDILSIRYMANAESRKLMYIPPREMDQLLPDANVVGTGKPQFYTSRGVNVELFRIPDANANLYIHHTMWPANMANETDEPAIQNIDDVIIQLTTEMTQAYMSGGSMTDWTKRALTLLRQSILDDEYHPDYEYRARPFNVTGRPSYVGEYWNNPWIKKQPREY